MTLDPNHSSLQQGSMDSIGRDVNINTNTNENENANDGTVSSRTRNMRSKRISTSNTNSISNDNVNANHNPNHNSPIYLLTRNDDNVLQTFQKHLQQMIQLRKNREL